MDTIIAVRGTHDSGKTSSIKRAFEMLRAAYPEATYKQHARGESDTHIVININGVKIGIETRGDPSTGLGDKLEELTDEEGCKIIICATRTRGQTVDAVDFYRDRNSIKWIEKGKAPTPEKWDVENNTTAMEIMRLFHVAVAA